MEKCWDAVLGPRVCKSWSPACCFPGLQLHRFGILQRAYPGMACPRLNALRWWGREECVSFWLTTPFLRMGSKGLFFVAFLSLQASFPLNTLSHHFVQSALLVPIDNGAIYLSYSQRHEQACRRWHKLNREKICGGKGKGPLKKLNQFVTENSTMVNGAKQEMANG